jgi:hypothetical protein
MPLGHHITRTPGTLPERSAAVLALGLVDELEIQLCLSCSVQVPSFRPR